MIYTVTILDGPAAPAVLSLQRVPLLLRVTIDCQGNVDALDQPEDEARLDERVFAYHLVDRPENVSRVHVTTSKPGGGRSGYWTAMVKYRLLAEQPDAQTLRDREAWVAWGEAKVERLLPDLIKLTRPPDIEGKEESPDADPGN